MSEAIHNLKVFSNPLYITSATRIGESGADTALTLGAGLLDGPIRTGNSYLGWRARNISVTGLSGAALVQGTLIHETRYDLQGLYREFESLQPLSSTLQKSEPFSMGPKAEPKNSQFYREYVLWTTERLGSDDLDKLVGLSSAPPYFDTEADPAGMNPSQVVAGQVEVGITKTDIAQEIGFLIPIFESALGFNDAVASPILYCTRVIYFNSNVDNATTFWVDIPSGTAIMSTLKLEDDDLLFLSKAVKSLDPPQSDTY